MIRKPEHALERGEGVAVRTVRTAAGVAQGGVTVARKGGHVAQGLFCYLLAVIWGFAALGGLLSGSLPTFVGVGAMTAFMVWAGRRAFAKAREPGTAGMV
jgi:hypothetical protein